MLAVAGPWSGANCGSVDFPPLVAESNETPAAENAELIKRCLPMVRQFADESHTKLGQPAFSHSDKWGDILRVTWADQDRDFVNRLACTRSKDVLGLTPSGNPEPVPQKMQGVWAKSRKCQVQSDRLVVTSTSIQFDAQKPFEVRYFPNHNSAGDGQLWTNDGTWLTPQFDPARDAMVLRSNSRMKTYYRCPGWN